MPIHKQPHHAKPQACSHARAAPWNAQVVADSKHVITLRDASSVAELDARLQEARRVVLIGNGGIALELAHALRGKHVCPRRACQNSSFWPGSCPAGTVTRGPWASHTCVPAKLQRHTTSNTKQETAAM